MIALHKRALLAVLLTFLLCFPLTIIHATPTEEELVQDTLNHQAQKNRICSDRNAQCAPIQAELQAAKDKFVKLENDARQLAALRKADSDKSGKSEDSSVGTEASGSSASGSIAAEEAAKAAEIAAAETRRRRKNAKSEMEQMEKGIRQIQSNAEAHLQNLHKEESSALARIQVAVNVPDQHRKKLIESGTSELQHDRVLFVKDAVTGVDNATPGTVLAQTRPQTEAVYRAIQDRIRTGVHPISLPDDVRLESLDALDPVDKSVNKLTSGKRQGNVNAIINVHGRKLGVIIHCDILRRRSLEALDANTNSRLFAKLQRRAIAGTDECKKKHANKVAANVNAFSKTRALNKDGSVNVKGSLANLKAVKPNAVGKITKSSLNTTGKVKSWPKVQIPPVETETTNSSGKKAGGETAPQTTSKPQHGPTKKTHKRPARVAVTNRQAKPLRSIRS
ncbi:hypothetical protein BC829DRAFT_415626 [Chytridium lagenaria]|nr:hypothetical protein BC829DRAFT_415626 [Chytridium lagenaria]